MTITNIAPEARDDETYREVAGVDDDGIRATPTIAERLVWLALGATCLAVAVVECAKYPDLSVLIFTILTMAAGVKAVMVAPNVLAVRRTWRPKSRPDCLWARSVGVVAPVTHSPAGNW